MIFCRCSIRPLNRLLVQWLNVTVRLCSAPSSSDSSDSDSDSDSEKAKPTKTRVESSVSVVCNISQMIEVI